MHLVVQLLHLLNVDFDDLSIVSNEAIRFLFDVAKLSEDIRREFLFDDDFLEFAEEKLRQGVLKLLLGSEKLVSEVLIGEAVAIDYPRIAAELGEGKHPFAVVFEIERTEIDVVSFEISRALVIPATMRIDEP